MIRSLTLIALLGLVLSAHGFAEEDVKKDAEAAANPVVVVDTTLGKFEIELYAAKSPITVKNFLQYVNDKFYDGTIFHRVMENFMIQGGGFTKDGMQKKPRDPIKNESGNGVKNVNYSIAMARTQDLNSATCQFFINVKDNAFLDRSQYCAFGMVVAGKDVVDKIKAVAVDKPGQLSEAQPKEPLVINSISLKKEAAEK